MLNTKYIANLERRISSINNCSELKQVMQEVLEYFVTLKSTVAAQVSLYGSLITPPTNIGQVITWITNVINTFIGPYNQAIAMQAQLISLEASVLSLITSRLGVLNCSTVVISDLKSMMRIPTFGVVVNGLSVYGGG